LIAPSTTRQRIKFLGSIADSFIYVVSKVRLDHLGRSPLIDQHQMGTTGSSNNVSINNLLPEIIGRIRDYTDIPLAVGFGVATREHFEAVQNAGADGVVIGSRIVNVIKNSSANDVLKNVEGYCQSIRPLNRKPQTASLARTPPSVPLVDETSNAVTANLPHRFGQFGGQYVPEALFDCLAELEAAHKAAVEDPSFWKEFESLFGYMNRPSNLYFAEKLTEKAHGAKIWLKREDL
jgi:tryptophan synthase